MYTFASVVNKKQKMDNYIVSARKYRPSTFRSVVGQRALTTTLRNAIESNKLAHAYLFCGPRGVGKTSCARIFAKTINCLNPTAEGEACNECESCKAFNEQRSYNIHELDAASNNSVDDIRSLIDQVHIPPAIGRYKVFIIDEVHMLSTAAFNAFLKTLEEPPSHALFILATTEKNKVLPTILSRCQVYDFSRISVADMVEHLEYVASEEHVTAEVEALNVIAQKADGGMRDALSIFDQVVSFTGGNITYQTVIDNLNVLDYEYYFRLTESILAGDVRTSLLTLNEILGKGFDGQNIITGLAEHFRDLLVARDESTLVLFEVGASIRERYKEMAKRCSEELLYKAIELANSCDLNYRVSRNKRLLLELTLIRLCQLSTAAGQTQEDKKKRVIEPIAAQTPKPTPQPQPKVQPVPTPHVVVPTPPEPAPEPVSKKIVQHIGVSMKEITNKGKDAEVAQRKQSDVPEMTTPFTEEDLVRCWDAYAASEKINGKVYMKNTMINCKPVLKDNFTFEVGVYNPGQKAELNAGSADLLQYLREQLKNTRLEMQVRVLESAKKVLVYTSTEKYNYLLGLNPALAKLVEEFNLRLE